MKLSPNLRKTEIIREKEKAAAGAAAAGDGPKKPPPKKKGEADPNAAEAKVLPTRYPQIYTLHQCTPTRRRTSMRDAPRMLCTTHVSDTKHNTQTRLKCTLTHTAHACAYTHTLSGENASGEGG